MSELALAVAACALVVADCLAFRQILNEIVDTYGVQFWLDSSARRIAGWPLGSLWLLHRGYKGEEE